VADPRFYNQSPPISVAALCELTGAELATPQFSDRMISGVAPLASATSEDVTFLQGKKHRASLAECAAGACLLAAGDVDAAPEAMAALIVSEPQRAFAGAIGAFYQSADPEGIDPGAHVHSDAKLETGVAVGFGSVIEANAEIGANTVIFPGAVIGHGVSIGRDCRIGTNVSIEKALIGDRVIIYPNAVIGSDGFGYAMGFDGHKKIPQIGRVIIQDDVDVGCGTAIDRGAMDDTVIGEGTKIDNLVQIAHNCRIGRHCVLAGMVGLSGSTILEDFVVLGGQAGSAGHLTVGEGTMVAGRGGIISDLPGGGVYGGLPAKPTKDWLREIAVLAKLAKSGRRRRDK